MEQQREDDSEKPPWERTPAEKWEKAKAKAREKGSEEISAEIEAENKAAWNAAADFLNENSLQEAEAAIRLNEERLNETDLLRMETAEEDIKYFPERAEERWNYLNEVSARQIKRSQQIVSLADVCGYFIEHGFRPVPQWEELNEEERDVFSPPPEAAYSPAGRRYFRAVYELREKPPFDSPTAYSRAIVRRVDGPADSTAALNWFKSKGYVCKGEALEDFRPRLEAQAKKMKAEGAF